MRELCVSFSLFCSTVVHTPETFLLFFSPHFDIFCFLALTLCVTFDIYDNIAYHYWDIAAFSSPFTVYSSETIRMFASNSGNRFKSNEVTIDFKAKFIDNHTQNIHTNCIISTKKKKQENAREKPVSTASTIFILVRLAHAKCLYYIFVCAREKPNQTKRNERKIKRQFLFFFFCFVGIVFLYVWAPIFASLSHRHRLRRLFCSIETFLLFRFYRRLSIEIEKQKKKKTENKLLSHFQT